jgi:alanine dehydrogenase
LSGLSVSVAAVLVLDQRCVADLLDPDALIDALGPALADLSAGRVELPARSAALMPGRPGFTGLLDMPCYSPSAAALTTKVTSVFPANAGGPTPVRQAAILVFDPADGTPAALLDGTYITAIRTGACSALSTRLLARADATTLAVLGTGVQARAHARTVARVRPFTELRIAGRDPAKATALAAELSGELEVPVRPCDSYRAALDGADVACATTFALEPVVRRAWVAPGTHVTSVGYNPAGRELDDALVADAALFVESRPAALHAVPPNLDLAQPIERGVITAEHVRAELGEVYAGDHPGRTDDAEITLYKSVGVAVEDAVAAALVLAAARERGAGVEVAL